MSQIGIPKYKDEINATKLNNIKDYINGLCIDYAKLTSSEAINNRESDIYEEYIKQYQVDLVLLKDISLLSQKLQNIINDSLFIISTRSLQQKIN